MRRLILFLALAISLAPLAHAQAPYRATFMKGVNVSHWLAQHPADRYADPARFNREDARWIAEQGYDHIRVPVDGRLLLDREGKLKTAMLEPFRQAVDWARENRLGIILDMHYLEGANFTPVSNALFGNDSLQARAATMWRQIAQQFRNDGSYLRFEVLNEAVADDNEQVNRLNELLVRSIREVDRDRVIYLSSNRWGSFSTINDLRVLPDPNVVYTLHYYEPFIFTHQAASWTNVPKEYPKPVAFPTTLTDIPDTTDLRRYQNVRLDDAYIDAAFDKVAAWAKANGVKELLLGEFGSYTRAPEEGRYNWTKAVRKAAERNGFGWTVWDYRGGFAVRNPDGSPTIVQKALFD